MPEIRNAGQDVQAEILKTVRRGQEVVVGTVRTWTETVRMITPPLPELNVPLRGKLPKPEELVGSAYDFTQKMLAGQRKLAEDVLHATAQLLPGHDDRPVGKNGSAAR